MKNDALSLYYSMVRIRMVEEALAANYYNVVREMKTPLHFAGQTGI